MCGGTLELAKTMEEIRNNLQQINTQFIQTYMEGHILADSLAIATFEHEIKKFTLFKNL